jgi:acyl-ACP thioesterase
MEIFEERCLVPREGMSPGDLFRLIQKLSGDHCRAIGYGETVMEEKGLMWVITRHGVNVLRWPAPGETLLARTWPGATRHGMCPRYYRIESESGELLITGCAIWSVVGRESRKMVVPEAYGVEIEPLVTGLESRRPGAPLRREGRERAEYTVSEEVLDENRHMNNTRYYDLAEQLLGTRGKPLREALVEYSAEAREGDRLLLEWSGEDGLFVISGSNNGAPAFRMNLRYQNEVQ